jgi:small-conductance mechanosensitive channel
MNEDTDPVQHADGLSRLTSPMQEFTMGQVTTGLVVFIIGIAVVFGVPLLL